jgi:NTP pyrophosphatase (non-canonical NTP hydrolase)
MGVALSKFRAIEPNHARAVIASHFYGVSRSVCDIIALATETDSRMDAMFQEFRPDKKKKPEVNKKEEVADSFWYVAILDRVLELNLEIPKITGIKLKVSNEKLIIDLYKISSKLLDPIKKKLYYNKPIDLSAFSDLSKKLFNTLCIFCEVNNIETESILDTNIAKLKARYGEKFSSEKAINRDLTTERLILEK